MNENPEMIVPAQCNENHELIDGQHRLEAAKRLDRPFYYYVVTGANIDTVRKLNDHDPRWSTSEFIHSFNVTGNKNYEIYDEFEKKYKFGHAVNIMLLADTDTYYNKMLDNFKSGNFEVKDLEKAEKMAQMLEKVGEYYPGYKKRTFAIALIKIMNLPNFNIELFISKLAYQQKKMIDCLNSTDYIEVIGDIYNYKTRKSSLIDITPLLYKKY